MQSLKMRERIDELLTDNILIGSRKSRQSKHSSAADAQFVFEISSKLLQRICIAEKILFELNDNDVQSDRCLYKYYTNNLVEPSTVMVGALLRDWKEIPGRDSVFDGIPTTLDTPPQEAIDVEHPSEIVKNEPADCVERASADPEPSEIVSETENDIVSSMEVAEKMIASADTDDTIIVDTNAIEVELDLINARIRSSQNFVDMPVSSVICGTEATAIESQRGPSPDLFDDDDYDCDGNFFETNSLTCAYKGYFSFDNAF